MNAVEDFPSTNEICFMVYLFFFRFEGKKQIVFLFFVLYISSMKSKNEIVFFVFAFS